MMPTRAKAPLFKNLRFVNLLTIGLTLGGLILGLGIEYGYPEDNHPNRMFIASWYSISSLKKEGTYKYSKGVCADGSLFKDNNLTAASRDYPLGAILRIINLQNGKSVTVKVTDRIGKRFKGKRIDLSKLAFGRIAELKQGIVSVKAEEIKHGDHTGL